MVEAGKLDLRLTEGGRKARVRRRQTLSRICRYLYNCNYAPVAGRTIAENLAAPVVRFAWKEIQVIDQIDLLSRNAAFALRGSLLRRLVWIADQTISWEQSIMDRGYDRGSTGRTRPSALLEEFCPAGVAQRTLRLLRDYPVLSQLWTVQVKCWQRLVDDFLTHSDTFVRNLKLGAGTERVITAIKPDLSDPHNGGRTVMRVRFAKTTEWYYKPRTGYQEIEWFNLLQWLNDEGFALPFQIVDVKSENRHCWMEAVRPKACRTRRELSRFYFRGGALSYLLHLLRGVDFHVGNLVVAGEQPVFVDIETLLHPATHLPAAAQAEEISILRTGLFPVANTSKDSVSAFGQCSWRSRDAKLRIRPSVRSNFVMDLLAGFRAMHTFVAEEPARVHYLESMVIRLAKLSGRNIYRPTTQYFSALTQSFASSLMRDNLDRSLFLLAFCTENAGSTHQVLAESVALDNADIPVFRARRWRIRLDFSAWSFAQSISLLQAKLNARA
jgi:lantibiotic modifying enzyme